jgi:histone H3/H4
MFKDSYYLSNMETISKPSITRLIRKAGIKSISDDCYDTVRSYIGMKLAETVYATSVVTKTHGAKTVSVPDLVEALRVQGTPLAVGVKRAKNRTKAAL